MTTLAKKEKLLEWLSSIQNDEIIDMLWDFKIKKSNDFNVLFKDAITADQVKEDTTSYIKSLDWKKQK